MIAAVLTAPRRLEIQEVPPPEPAAGEQLVAIHTAGICGTDLHGYQGDNPLLSLPRILGHELSGTVIGGDGPYAAGTRVAIDPMITCGECYACRHGRRNCCVDMKVIGVHVDGGYRPQFALPFSMLHPLPDSVSLELGALCEPLTIGANACLRGEVDEDVKVLIQGAGTIGLCCLLLAKARGAEVIIADTIAGRLELATRLGADATVQIGVEDDEQKVLAFTDGDGPGVVIEAAGHPAVLRRALDLVAPSGIVVDLMISRQELTFPVTATLIKKELDLRGSRLNRDLFPQVIDLIARGVFDPSPLITARYPLAEANEAFEAAGGGGEVKVVLEVEESA